MSKETLAKVWTLRRMISAVGSLDGTQLLLERMVKTKSNEQFLATLNKDV